MDEPKTERIERQQKLKDIAMDGVKFGKVGKLENCKFYDEMQCRSEEKFVQVDIERSCETQTRETRDVGRCRRKKRTRRHMHR